MDKHIEVIGIDHGWSGMKTVSQVFTTGVKEITTEPAFFNNVVEYNGSYYKVGGRDAPEEEDTKETGEDAKPSGSGGAGTSKRKIAGEDTIMNRMAQWQYSKEQKEELHKMMALGMTKAEILAVFYPETDVAKMREIRRTYRVLKTNS